jgi:nucleoside-diphosphate-sugar epimerase
MSANSIAITGVSGNLGVRLLEMLGGKRVLGLDVMPLHQEGLTAKGAKDSQSTAKGEFTFARIDLGREESCKELVRLFREHRVDTVLHLAFVLDPLKAGVLDRKRMWQINVAGTARLLEAIAEVNRMQSGRIRRLVALSSVSVYGPETPDLVNEEHDLCAHTLTYAVHKKEMDEVIRRRAEALGECEVVVLRPPIFVGPSMHNYMAGSLKGDAYGKGWLGHRMREKHSRLPMLLPAGEQYLRKKFQFIHVDDVARLIRHIVGEVEKPGVKVFNVASRGEALDIERAAELCDAKLVRVPTRLLARTLISLAWKMGISSVPPDSFPYLCGTYTMDTNRLRKYLGREYENVIRHTNESALRSMFENEPKDSVQAEAVKA